MHKYHRVTFNFIDSWGYKNATGHWDGMMGQLQRKEIDFGGTGIFLSQDRIGVVHYIPLTTPTGYVSTFVPITRNKKSQRP